MFTRLVFWILTTRYPEAVAPIFTLSASKDVVLRRNVPFAGPKTKKYILTHFLRKKRDFWSIFDGTENFGSKRALTWGTSSVNTPKRQVRHWKLDAGVNVVIIDVISKLPAAIVSWNGRHYFVSKCCTDFILFHFYTGRQ